MSDEPLTEAAVEFTRAGFLFWNVMERDEFTGQEVTDDFVADDRSGFNNGLMDAVAYHELMKSTWDVGSGRPTWTMQEMIAVRGQRVASLAAVVDYGGEWHTDAITSICLDPPLQLLQRRVMFDIDDRDAAIAEVDRMHAEIDD